MRAKFINEINNDIFKPKELSDEEKRIWDFPEPIRKHFKGIYAVHIQPGETHAERGYLYANNTLVEAMGELGVNNCLAFKYKMGEYLFYKKLSDFIFSLNKQSDVQKRSQTFDTWESMNIVYRKEGWNDINLYAHMSIAHSGLGREYGMLIINNDLILEILNLFPNLNYINAGNNKPLTAEEVKRHLRL